MTRNELMNQIEDQQIELNLSCRRYALSPDRAHRDDMIFQFYWMSVLVNTLLSEYSDQNNLDPRGVH